MKRLLQKFLKEDMDRGDDGQSFRENADTYSRRASAENHRESIREPEARVLYKYPKGQFKFPLIPDSPEPVEKERVKREKDSPPAHFEEFSQPEEEESYVDKTPTANDYKAPQQNQKTFRPREIPSPIFAFKRPVSEESARDERAKIDSVRVQAAEQAAALEQDQPAAVAPKWSQAQNVRELKQAEEVHEVPVHEDAEEKAMDHSKRENLFESVTEQDEKMVEPKNPSDLEEEETSIEYVEEQNDAEAEPVSFDHQQEQQEAEIGHSNQEEASGMELENRNDAEKTPVFDKQHDDIDAGEAQEQDVYAEPEKNETEDTGILDMIAEKEDNAENVSADPEEKVFGFTEAGNHELVKETVIDREETNAEQGEAWKIADRHEEVIESRFDSVSDQDDEIIGLKQEGTDKKAEPFFEGSEEVVPEAKQVHLEEKEETEKATPKKKIVPFNVLMLKKDKRNLEKQREKGREAQVNLDRPPLNETTDINELPELDEPLEIASSYQFPPLDLLNPPVQSETNADWLVEQEKMLDETLKNFNVGAKVVNVTQGPAVTRFEVQPEPGVKVNKITNLSDDIKLSLAARDIRMEAPIPGKHTIGIEVPNAKSRPVFISEILKTDGFKETESPLAVVLGLDIAGTPIVTDLKKMPHGLIAGATGSGKSVCINSMLVSLLYKSHPDDVKLLLIDPKMVELAPYNHIPHLVSPVITDVKAATASLKWAVEEMERRYELFAHTGVRDISRFNELAIEHKRYAEKLPYIVIVIDELADLMMMSPADVEEAISRIAQKARACGIHLIIATQRPSVDVITGLIKANVPTRIAFSVSSQVDSRTIIDISGAEKLLGRGDMLFLESGSSKPFRLQGTFVSDREIDDVVAFVREQRAPNYLFEQEELLKKSQVNEEEDDLFYEACVFVIEQGGASTSSVQRRFKIGYNRAARLIDMMEQNGFISETRGSKPRDVLISLEELEALQ